MNATPSENLAAIRYHLARTFERPAPRSTRSLSTARVTLSIADGYDRLGDASLDLTEVDVVDYDGDQTHWSEAIGDAYPHLANANWIRESATECRAVVEGRIYVAVAL